MRFKTWFGSAAQTQPGTEGDRLIRSGLLRPVPESGETVGIEATDRLNAYFPEPPAMELLYPLLVEFVASRRFNLPEFADESRVTEMLRSLGMSEEGLATLRWAAG